MNMLLNKRVWVLADDIDTDIIIPTQYLALKTVEEMKDYAFSPLRPELASSIQNGDIIVAGSNFGCGSSREQAPEVIRALGISCIVAKSFARIFYRNSINNGVLLIENEELADICNEGDTITVDLNESCIIHKDKKYNIPELPGELTCILQAGGLVKYLKEINKQSNI